MLLAQEPWYLSTADRGRRRLFPRGIVALFGFAMLLVGWLALPAQSLQERLANAQESDALTVAYLNAWLNASPGNWQLHMTLARHQTLLGDLDDALRTLRVVERQGPARLLTQARHLRLSVLERMAFEAPAGSQRRASLLARVADGLSSLARHTDDPVTLEAYYHRALAIRAPWLAAQIIARMGELGIEAGRLLTEVDLTRVREYARAAIGLGDFRLAAQLYWRAFDATTDAAQRADLLAQVARAEQLGARLPEFFVALESRLEGLPLDLEQCKWLARLALSANRLDLAERFARRMLRFSGGWSAATLAHVEMTLHRLRHGMGAVVRALSPITEAHAAVLEHRPRATPARDADLAPGELPSAADPLADLISRLEARENVAAQRRRALAAPRIRMEPVGMEPTASGETPDPLADLLHSLGELPGPAPTTAGPEVAAGPQAPPNRPMRAVAPPSTDPRDGQSVVPVAMQPVPRPVIEIGPYAAEPGPSFTHANGELGGTSRVVDPAARDQAFGELVDGLSRDAASRTGTPRDDARRSAHNGAPQLPFDDEAYRLAFQIFVANGNLDDAYAVASSAIEQVPQNWVWHIRAAEVAEWSQRPVQALDGWFRLARATGEARFWSHVERLAAGLRDFDKLNAFLSWRLAAHPGDLGSLLRLAENYEALGQVESAIRLVRERLESTNEAGEDFELRTALAGLAQRAGDRELLLATLRDMDLRYGPDPARAARQAHVLEVAGRPSEAFDALVAALAVARLPDGLSAAQERESRYWASLAHLAEVMQRPALALEAHAQMLSLDTYDAQQLRDAATLLQTGSPSRAADLLAHGFRRFGEPGFAHAAVGAWFAAGQPGRVEAFLATLPEPMAGRIRADKGFLKQRAAYYQSVERLDEALADLIQVYRIAPGDMDNRAAMLWTLLAKRDARRLRAALDRWAEDARDNPALWGPFGASLLALDEPQRALPYFVWQARDSRDYLWWLAYADALDSAGRPDAAWQLRRRAWTELRNHPQPQRPADPVIRTRVLALAMRFSPADEARELLRALMRNVAGMVETEAPVVNDALTVGAAPTEERAGSPAQARRLAIALREEVARIDTLPPAVGDLVAPSGGAELRAMRVAASELIVSYLISREGNEAARGWLLSRYARDLAKPAWAELALALTRRDDEALDRLLATVSDWLPKLDQIEAQRRLGRFASAQTLAFDTATSRPDDDSAHQKLVEAVLSGAPSAGVSVSSERQGALAREIVRSDVAVRLDQHSKLYGFARRTAQSSGDPALLGTVPRRLRELGMGVRRIAPRGDWWIEGARRDGAGSATVLRLGVQHVIDPSIDVDAALALNETADESAALSAIGRRDALRLGAHWNISARDYLRVRLAAARLESHAGTRLGNTRRTAVEVGHRVRIASPDLTVRAVASHLDVDGTGASDDLVRAIVPAGVAEPDKVLLPASGAQLDLYVTAGMTTADSYTRALQPFAELGAHHNALTGGSVSLRAGVNTSLFGADQLTLFAAYSRETTGAGKGTHELGLAYRLYY